MHGASRPAARWWCVALAGALAFVGWDNAQRIGHLLALQNLPGVNLPPPEPAADSATGFSLGRRTLILPRATLDTYHWIMQGQEMLVRGESRLRHVDYDNAPLGREVHWALPLHAWLAGLARADRALSGRSLGAAVERAALFSNPLLLLLLLAGLVPLVAWRFGSAAAALLAVGMVSSYPFYLNFTAGNAEHHGAAEACALLTVICLLGGAGRPGRLFLLASAAAGGLGLWISAASEAPILLGTGLGALVSLLIQARRPDGEPAAFPAEGWRLWGRAGCSVSLLAYAFEYFPSHLGWRLEVNHPLYALAWLGGGELLGRLGRRTPGERRALAGSELAALLLGLVAVGLLPAVILLTGSKTFLIADPFLWRLHTRYILEFQGMGSYLIRRGLDFTAIARLLPLLVTLPALFFLVRPGTPSFTKSQLALAVVPAGLELLLAAQQIRWWGLASGLALVTALPLFAYLERAVPAADRRRGWRLACVLLLLPGAVSALQLMRADAAYTQEDVFGLAERDLAHWLRLRAGSNRAIVLSTPDTTTSLLYHSSLPGLGTLYWENRDGLRAAAEIFAATSSRQAWDLIRARGVTTIVLVSWDPFWGPYVRLARGLPPAPGVPPDSFAGTLLGAAPLPAWLRAVAYPLPRHPALRGQRVWIFEVRPGAAP